MGNRQGSIRRAGKPERVPLVPLLYGTYMATCVPGGESILAEEVRSLADGFEDLHWERGKVFWYTSKPYDIYFSLRCADNIYRVLARFQVGPHKADLDVLEQHLASMDFRSLGRGRRIMVSASRAGKHTYSRYDLAARAASALARQGYQPVAEGEVHDIAFRLDVRDGAAMFSMQLTSAQFRFRGEAFLSSPGGIRPTVAQLLVQLSQPKDGESFCDPFCGAGTIPFERAVYPVGRIVAGDIDAAVLQVAKKNLGDKAELVCADAAHLPLEDGCMDVVVTNMPWGKQIQVDDLYGLYNAFCMKLSRILKPKGRAVLFTDQEAPLVQACRNASLSLRPLVQLSLHGLHPTAYWVEKK